MRILLPVLLLASLGLAQIFGPAGVPLAWDFGIATFNADSIVADKFTTSGATSYLSMTSSAAADSLVWTQTGTAGDRDMVIKAIDDLGVDWLLVADDALNLWNLNGRTLYTTGTIQGNTGLTVGGVLGIRCLSGMPQLWSTSDIQLDPNINGGGNVYIGDLADEDTLVSYAVYNNFTGLVDADTLQMDAVYGLIRYIDADYAATATDWQIIATDTCRVTLPALSVAYDALTATTGYGLQLDIFCSAATACTISTAADSIWGNAEIVLAPGDNASLRAGEDWWILR